MVLVAHCQLQLQLHYHNTGPRAVNHRGWTGKTRPANRQLWLPEKMQGWGSPTGDLISSIAARPATLSRATCRSKLPIKYRLVVNMKTAKALGFALPLSILMREVIE